VCLRKSAGQWHIVSVTVNDTWFISIYCVAGFANSLATFSVPRETVVSTARRRHRTRRRPWKWAGRWGRCGSVDPKDMSEILT
jgi:hypothetical protein